MFSVKHYRYYGQLELHHCDKYSRDTETPSVIRMFTYGRGWEVLEFRSDESIFVENGNGKTIDMIRPPKSPD